jgi:hypothetical protein
MIGMIMEDTSVVALTLHGHDSEAQGRTIAQLSLAAKKITALAEAAAALCS